MSQAVMMASTRKISPDEGRAALQHRRSRE